MFEEHAQYPLANTMPLLAWLEHNDGGDHRARARNTLRNAMEHIPALGRFLRTPQSAPWHVEGPVVRDHIERILFALEVCVEQGGLLAIEEFRREKDLELEILALERTLREYAIFLSAFALAHDAAKPELLSFDAKEGTKGAREGFAQHDKRAKKHASDAEIQRYDKLLRAFAAAHPSWQMPRLMTAFYAEYGIETHYDLHGPRAASHEYAPLREEVMRHVGLSASYAKLLTEVIRYHIDVLHDVDGKKYELIAARAGKAGLNVDVMLDVTLAHVFLDAVAGSITSTGATTDLVIRHMRAERDAFPRRHEERVLARDRAVKQAYKQVLVDSGLEGDTVFALLGTPIGPERGEVMRRIQDAIRDAAAKPEFGSHTGEILRRIALVRARLSGL